MKIAVSVRDEALNIYNNAGHTPYFAIFEQKGAGMFRSFAFSELRPNPRMAGADQEEIDGSENGCSHDERPDQEAEDVQRKAMAESIGDCEWLVTPMACKNTARVMKEAGVKIKKLPSGTLKAEPAAFAGLFTA